MTIDLSVCLCVCGGVVSEPRCGFSRQMVEVLRSGGVAAFGSFDILQDPEVRQGLKAYSNWPTCM